MRQYTITKDYEQTTLINIVEDKEIKKIKQSIKNSFTDVEVVSEIERNVEIFETIPYVNNTCGSVFKSYTDIIDNSLLLETYMQYYAVSENSDRGLLSICGIGEKDMHIIYLDNQPIYANFHGSKDKEIAGYPVNTKTGAQFIIDSINEEVNAIVTKINAIFDNYEKEYNNQKKLKK